MSSPNPAPAHPVSLPARLPARDGLRAIAILLVLPHNLNLIATFSGTQLVVAALHRGWIGVQLFFVLSGFLITRILGYTFLAVAFALSVAAGAAADHLGAAGWPGVLRWPPLRRVAKYSYAMYVLSVPLHFLVGKPVLLALGLASTESIPVDLAYIIVGTALSFLAAAASFHLLEVHFLKLKDRLAPPL
jgi:peptidoglycan/LPS O-acetylase OafA/YrhL